MLKGRRFENNAAYVVARRELHRQYFQNEGARAVDEARSVATNTNVPEVSEYLFIRLKKRAKIVSFHHLSADILTLVLI